MQIAEEMFESRETWLDSITIIPSAHKLWDPDQVDELALDNEQAVAVVNGIVKILGHCDMSETVIIFYTEMNQDGRLQIFRDRIAHHSKGVITPAGGGEKYEESFVFKGDRELEFAIKVPHLAYTMRNMRIVPVVDLAPIPRDKLAVCDGARELFSREKVPLDSRELIIVGYLGEKTVGSDPSFSDQDIEAALRRATCVEKLRDKKVEKIHVTLIEGDFQERVFKIGGISVTITKRPKFSMLPEDRSSAERGEISGQQEYFCKVLGSDLFFPSGDHSVIETYLLGYDGLVVECEHTHKAGFGREVNKPLSVLVDTSIDLSAHREDGDPPHSPEALTKALEDTIVSAVVYKQAKMKMPVGKDAAEGKILKQKCKRYSAISHDMVVAVQGQVSFRKFPEMSSEFGGKHAARAGRRADPVVEDVSVGDGEMLPKKGGRAAAAVDSVVAKVRRPGEKPDPKKYVTYGGHKGKKAGGKKPG